jgi:hypothetical protein
MTRRLFDKAFRLETVKLVTERGMMEPADYEKAAGLCRGPCQRNRDRPNAE